MATDLTTLFRQADEAGTKLAVDEASIDAVHGDAVLFDAVQIPVVAFAVIACITSRRGGESLNVIGARVGHALMSAFPMFGQTRRYLKWSIRVRTVTVEALSFLEGSGLIAISLDVDRTATVTTEGRKFLKKLRGANDDSSQLFELLAAAMSRTRNHELTLL